MTYPTIGNCLLPARAVFTDTDDNVQAIVTCIQTLAVTLRAVADEGEGIVLEVLLELGKRPVTTFPYVLLDASKIESLDTACKLLRRHVRPGLHLRKREMTHAGSRCGPGRDGGSCPGCKDRVSCSLRLGQGANGDAGGGAQRAGCKCRHGGRRTRSEKVRVRKTGRRKILDALSICPGHTPLGLLAPAVVRSTRTSCYTYIQKDPIDRRLRRDNSLKRVDSSFGEFLADWA